MIDVLNCTYADAEKKLATLDSSIEIQTEWVYDDTHPRNIVIQQSVKEGTDFTKGSIRTILLTVSKGSTPVAEETDENNTKQHSSSDNNTSQKITQKSGSSNKTTTSKSTTEQSNYNIHSIEDELSSFTID
jgi:hypothetical protein